METSHHEFSRDTIEYTEPSVVRHMKEVDVDQVMRFVIGLYPSTYIDSEHGVTEQDVAAAVEELSSPELEQLILQYYNRELDDGSKLFIVAENPENNDLVGILEAFSEDDGTCTLARFYVAETMHGKGVAGDLMETFEAWVDGRAAQLQVGLYNERATKFYKRYGFDESTQSASHHPDIPQVKMKNMTRQVLKSESL